MKADPAPSHVATGEHEEALYRRVADTLRRLIEEGTLPPGERMPSVRRLSRERGISITTVLHAYRLLENGGYLEVRAQSGHYVRSRLGQRPAARGGASSSVIEAPPELGRPLHGPVIVNRWSMISTLLADLQNPNLLQLGAVVPDPELLPIDRLHRTLISVARRLGAKAEGYQISQGLRALRVEIARRMMVGGADLAPDDLIVTLGAQEGVNLCLRAICQPGETVAVESPCYYGFLQILELQGLKALELPVHPREGLSLEALGWALEHHPIKAALLIPNFNNPSGFTMPDDRKQALVGMLSRRGIPIIEDDLYGDLAYDDQRPRLLKAYDRAGLVLSCSSISKTLAPGFRVGWAAPGRWKEDVRRLKIVGTVSNPSLPQFAIADFLANGGYERHLRQIRREYRRRTQWLSDAVVRHFPQGTSVSQPEGGFHLWVELPEGCDTLSLYPKAVAAGMTLGPGVLFSTSDRFRRCLRLNAAFARPEIEPKIEELGSLVRRMQPS